MDIFVIKIWLIKIFAEGDNVKKPTLTNELSQKRYIE